MIKNDKVCKFKEVFELYLYLCKIYAKILKIFFRLE
jgi:hypothetical protein